MVGGHTSEWADVTSGVPQGSVLGPLLFVLYINDLPDNILDFIKIYADDAKVLAVIRSPEDTARLQVSLDLMVIWSETWLLFLNEFKCKVMHVNGLKCLLSPAVYTIPSASGGIHTLAVTRVEKDLGILISDDLKCAPQVAAAAARGYQALGRLKKAFTSRDRELWRRLYLVYVRPLLDYASQVWSPYLVGDIKKLEGVQRAATSTIAEFHFPRRLTYEERLVRLDLQSLEVRRQRGDLIQHYNFRSGRHTINWTSEQRVASEAVSGRTRANKQKPAALLHTNGLIRQRAGFYLERLPVKWNMLSAEDVAALSLNAFKNCIDRRLPRL